MDGPCYRCLYPECPKSNQVMSCRVDGVVGMAPGITGQLLATQLLKLVLGLDSVLCKKLLVFNLLTDVYKVLRIRGRRADCAVCSPSNLPTFDIKAFSYEEFTGTSCAVPNVLDKGIPDVKWQDLSSDHLSQCKIIDVRPQEQFNICRIVSAQYLTNIPYSKLTMMSAEEIKVAIGLDGSDEPVYVLCRAGVTSIKACNYLSKQGFQPINMEKGLNGYLKLTSAEFEL